MHRSSKLALALGVLGLATAAGAETLQYTYDARGRLIWVFSGVGAKTTYTHDAADNRINRQSQLQFPTAWEAESLPHVIGYADADGWAANVTLPSNYLTYGPYTTTMPVGVRTGTWRMLIDVRNATDSTVLTIDAYDATAGQQLAAQTITRHRWVGDYAYQVFELPFTLDASRAGHMIELRTFYHGTSYVRVDKIGYF